MKKIMLTLMVLAMALPAMADVTVTAADGGSGVLEITITADAGLRGVALDVQLSNGATANSSGVSYDAAAFNCVPDYASDVVKAAGTYTLGAGHPLAKAGNNPGELIGDASNFAICMGSLDENGVDPKGEALGAIVSVISIQLADNGAADTLVTISADTARGGIVGDALGTVVADATTTVVFGAGPCVPPADEAEWNLVGQPASWCTPNQCYGDANGSSEVYGRGTVAVGMEDVAILVAGFRKPGADPAWIGADFSRSAEVYGRGTVRVGMQDVDILVANFRKPVPGDCNP